MFQTGIQRISTVLIPQQKYRGHTGATIFSPSPLGNGGFSVGAEVGEDPRKEEANGRGRTGSCRRPADHGDLLSVSDKGEWWLGSTAVKCATRQWRLITVGCGSSSAMQTYNLPFICLLGTGARKPTYYRIQLINVFQEYFFQVALFKFWAFSVGI